MKARRSGIVGCGHPVCVGDLIVKVNGRAWICSPCRLAEIRDLEQTMTALPRPSRCTERETAGQLPLEAS
jgi:hypothetical protein